MAVNDILAQSGDSQDFVMEIPAGNGSNTPSDILIESDDALLVSEVPEVTGGGGGNIFIMSE